MNSLFPKEKIVFNVPDAEIEYFPNFFESNLSDDFFEKLKNEIPWQQDKITVYGKTHQQPRLTALLATRECPTRIPISKCNLIIGRCPCKK